MQKNFVEGFDCPVCGPNSIYTCIKLCEKQFLSFIAWPISWSLEYCTHSAKLPL